MVEDRRYKKRIKTNEPASLRIGDDVFEGTIVDVSDSGALIEFRVIKGEAQFSFDIGSQVEINSESLKHPTSRVVRHYDGGFAINFEGRRVIKKDT